MKIHLHEVVFDLSSELKKERKKKNILLPQKVLTSPAQPRSSPCSLLSTATSILRTCLGCWADSTLSATLT